MPKMLVLSSDHGAEFSSLFTQVCTFNDIVHKGSTPSRSQSMGTVELANKLLQQNLSRICSSSAAGRLHWPKLLPRLIGHINSFYPYKYKLSQVQILFSPFINCPGDLQVQNPVQFQHDTFKTLNANRIDNLLNKKRSSSRFPFKIGQYCTLQDDIAVKDDSKKLRVPVSREIWKIVDILKNGFLIKNLNVRSWAENQLSIVD